MGRKVWMNGGEAIRACLHERLLPKTTIFEAPKTINLFDEFRSLLLENGAPQTEAEERALRWIPRLVRETEDQLVDWDEQGLPRPFQWLNRPNTCVTWNHPEFAAITGLDALSPSFIDLYQWVKSLKESELLLAGVMFARELRAQPILVVDGKGDGGIDIVARVSHGPLRSTLLVMQSKTQTRGSVRRQTVLSEYAKYVMSSNDGVLREYLRATDLHQAVDGSAVVYMFISNTEFEPEARSAARGLGILLRSARQLAQSLSQQANRETLADVLEEVRPFLKRDLDRDHAKLMARYL